MHQNFEQFRQYKIQQDKAWGYGGREADLVAEYEKYLASAGVEGGAEQALAGELEAANTVILTTETAPDIKITKRLEIITAECVFGMNVFKDLFAGVADLFGGRSGASQSVLRDARKTVLAELKREAHAVGANAVVGVDLDYSEISGKGMAMLFVVASGTAVVADLDR